MWKGKFIIPTREGTRKKTYWEDTLSRFLAVEKNNRRSVTLGGKQNHWKGTSKEAVEIRGFTFLCGSNFSACSTNAAAISVNVYLYHFFLVVFALVITKIQNSDFTFPLHAVHWNIKKLLDIHLRITELLHQQHHFCSYVFHILWLVHLPP